jgi:hypothetical protein
MRGGNHSQDIREYEINSSGMVIAPECLKNYQHLITGIPERLNQSGNKAELPRKSGADSKT